MPELRSWLGIAMALVLIVIFIIVVLFVLSKSAWSGPKDLGGTLMDIYKRIRG